MLIHLEAHCLYVRYYTLNFPRATILKPESSCLASSHLASPQAAVLILQFHSVFRKR